MTDETVQQIEEMIDQIKAGREVVRDGVIKSLQLLLDERRQLIERLNCEGIFHGQTE